MSLRAKDAVPVLAPGWLGAVGWAVGKMVVVFYESLSHVIALIMQGRTLIIYPE